MGWLKHLAAVVLLAASAEAVMATAPRDYVLLDIEIKGITVEGVSRRLELLRTAPDDTNAQVALDNEIQARVRDAFAAYGTTVNDHLHYYHANSEAIAVWLDEHPQFAHQLESMRYRLAELSEQINGLMGAAPNAK